MGRKSTAPGIFYPTYNHAMSIRIDPEQNETNALFSLPITWKEKSVLEIGSGDGRLTWRFADQVRRAVAIEPDAEKHAVALKNQPQEMRHVQFLNLGLDAFTNRNKEKFDLVLLSWSL